MNTDKQLQHQVTLSLSWTEQRHNEFIYSCGLSYLKNIAGDFPAVFSQISKSERFWNWWKAHWDLRDREFIETIDESPEAIIDVETLYQSIHDPDVLAAAKFLNGQVLEESYAELILQLTKDQYEERKTETKTPALAIVSR
jgi:hypothetical protein